MRDNVEKAAIAAETNAGSRKENPRFFGLNRKQEEKQFSFIRRIVFHHILLRTPVITLYELIQELEAITDSRVTKAFLLATIIFPDSGLVIEGDLLSYTILRPKQLQKVRYKARRIIDSAGGKIDKELLLDELTNHFRSRGMNLKKMPISSCLFNSRTKFRCETTENKEIAFCI